IILCLAAAMPAQAKGMHQAMKEMAADIKAKHQAAGRSETAPPSKPLGSSKTVHFTLPMKKGQGRNSVDQYCMGYTLKCVARVKNPDNTYSGKVSTSEGSNVDFKDKKNGEPLELTLGTSFFGDTTFSLFMWAQDDPFPELAQVVLTCSY
ncbi:MAG: hypothetical protein K9K36_06560, partial [Desulfarculaceae bacterium]|nr:hypothetical protein [Desulfarculaceae bacterium]